MNVNNKKIELDFNQKKKKATYFLAKMKILEGLLESKQKCIA